LNIRQIGRMLQRQLGMDSARFVEEARNDSLIKILDVQTDNLEGFLFPNTYEISFGTGNNEREVVRTMFTEFRRRMTPEIMEEMSNQKLSLLELITMASIIDGETRFEPEKKTIAGVYYNRLKKNMKLEADPTVQYVLPDGPKRRLLFSDLKFASPYNTYLNKGLPPGPINNPGWGSILAALYPESSNYLYFAAKGDGSHRFAETYDEHKKNAKLYRDYLDQLEKDRENK
jgi:peptidoglycan lytic transglycosylase G